MEVVVATGNIVDADADVVVVSANTSLNIEGRAGAALASHGGPGIRAALEARARRGGIAVGDVVYTDAGHHARIRTIAWAVIREYRAERPDIGDDNAVLLASDTLWRTIVAGARSAAALRVAVVPLAAVELGAERAATLIAASLAAATDVHRQLARVTFVTADAGDGAALLRGVRTVFPAATTPKAAPGAAARKATTSTAASPPPLPSPPAPAPPPPPRFAPKDTTVGSVVVEHSDSCARVAPTGCGGVLFRVRRRDAPAPYRLTVRAAGVVADVAVDGVPVGDNVMLLDGEHVLTCRVRSPRRPEASAHLEGLLSHGYGGRYTTTEPPAGWRDVDFDDADWSALLDRPDPNRPGPADGAIAAATIWVRIPFTTQNGSPR